jgi:hypothetical protein
MPLVAPIIEKKLSTEIQAELKKAFGAGADAESGAASHKKMADAIAAAVAKVIVAEITTNASVLPGIPTAGSPAAQTSVGPGKIG